MKYSCKELKAMARNQLAGHYGIYIGAFMLYTLINITATSILSAVMKGSTVLISASGEIITENIPGYLLYTVITLLVNLILSVLVVGFNKMFLDGSRGYQIKFEDLFYGFRHHPDRIIIAQFILQIISTICMLPLDLVITHLNIWPMEFIIIALVATVIGEIIWLFISILFCQAMFLLADYDDIGAMQALKESVKLMKGNKGKYLYMSFSFFGMIVLSIFSCYIGYLWVFPYMMMTETNFYRAVMGEI